MAEVGSKVVEGVIVVVVVLPAAAAAAGVEMEDDGDDFLPFVTSLLFRSFPPSRNSLAAAICL